MKIFSYPHKDKNYTFSSFVDNWSLAKTKVAKTKVE